MRRPSCSRTLARCSGIGWPSIFHMSGRSQSARAFRLVSAQRPSRYSPSAAVSRVSSSLAGKASVVWELSVVTDIAHSLLFPEKSEERIRRQPETLHRNRVRTPSRGVSVATSLLMFYYSKPSQLALGEHEFRKNTPWGIVGPDERTTHAHD